MRRTLRILTTIILAAALGGCATAGQLRDRAENAARNAAGDAVDREVGDRTDEAVSGAFDRAEEGVRCVVGDDACIEEARREGRTVVVMEEDGTPVNRIPGEAAGGAGPASNYDFEPGDRVLFGTDFSADRAGDFPKDLEFVAGNWDVVVLDGRRWLRDTGSRGSSVNIPLGETLPERFTVQLDVLYTHGNHEMVLTTAPPRGSWREMTTGAFRIADAGSGIVVPDGQLESVTRLARDAFTKAPATVEIMVDGNHAKMFVDGTRVANVPNVEVRRGDRIQIQNTYFSDTDAPIYVGSVRVAAGGRDLYEALAREGRVVTRGIHFDSGSARLRPASRKALVEIADMMREHPDLELVIEGHTDGVGSEETNLALSRQRAGAVRRALMDEHGVPAGRLEAAGYGERRPVADNETPEGRQQNRRVELVRKGG